MRLHYRSKPYCYVWTFWRNSKWLRLTISVLQILFVMPIAVVGSHVFVGFRFFASETCDFFALLDRTDGTSLMSVKNFGKLDDPSFTR